MESKTVKYIRTVRQNPFFAIAALDPTGTDKFVDQEGAEAAWISFEPAKEERDFAYELQGQGGGKTWPNTEAVFAKLKSICPPGELCAGEILIPGSDVAELKIIRR